MFHQRPWLLTAALCLAGTALSAGVLIKPRDAPAWEVSEWLGGDPGRLQDHKGRVVVIEFFQLWCPGSNGFSIPLLERWDELYGSNEDVLIVSIHSVFEGKDVQTPERLRSFVSEKGFRHVVGIDALSPDKPGKPGEPITMDRFGVEGTPAIVIVDKEGQIVFSHFGEFDPGPVEGYLDRLMREKSKLRPRAKPAMPRFEALLTGAYNVWVEETSRSCGPPEGRQKTRVQIDVKPDHIEATADRPYFGVQKLNLSYDPATGKFQTDMTQRVKDEGVPFTLRLKLEGRFLPDASPPKLEYGYSFGMLSTQQPERNCDVEGRGGADRVGS